MKSKTKLHYKELIKLSKARLLESKVLFKNGFYHGSIYLGGYSIELALKAVIVKNLNKEMYFEPDVGKKIYDHDFNNLFSYLTPKNQIPTTTLNILKMHNVNMRYQNDKGKKEATDFHKEIKVFFKWIKVEYKI